MRAGVEEEKRSKLPVAHRCFFDGDLLLATLKKENEASQEMVERGEKRVRVWVSAENELVKLHKKLLEGLGGTTTVSFLSLSLFRENKGARDIAEFCSLRY